MRDEILKEMPPEQVFIFLKKIRRWAFDSTVGLFLLYSGTWKSYYGITIAI